ncbi:hypothetical protein ACLOJK_021795 [Asimina triloba]
MNGYSLWNRILRDEARNIDIVSWDHRMPPMQRQCKAKLALRTRIYNQDIAAMQCKHMKRKYKLVVVASRDNIRQEYRLILNYHKIWRGRAKPLHSSLLLL